ncbi:MAG TPA: YheC/YheD family protein [Symbiobacteriaceae bacterium]|nr:YheC/YheD family protein [Symbiobacteriaceae bacterium]
MPPVHLAILLRRPTSNTEPFGAVTPFVQNLTRLGVEEGVEVTAVYRGDVNQRTRRMLVTRYLGPEGGWQQEERGLPDVLWNRCLRHDRHRILPWFGREGVALFFQRFLNKWQAHQLLRQDEAIAPHLPETHLLEEGEQLLDLLDRYPTAYIKPINGSLGKGIMRVEPATRRRLKLRYVSPRTGRLRELLATADDLDDWLDDDEREGQYIAQQGLALDLADARPVDLRLLLQKDRSGEWGVTGLGARRAAADRFTANLHTGGEGVPLDAIVTETGLEAKTVAELAGQLGLQIAHSLESCCGPLGELGIDFGLDRSGRLWLIEENARPGRALFSQIGPPDLAEATYRRPLQYVRHLAEAKSGEEEATMTSPPA